jgi:hypothetical protein
MKLGVLSFVVVLLAAPLAAQAAESPARFAITLRAMVVDRIAYEATSAEDECRIHRNGFGVRALRLRSRRPTRIGVTGGPDGAVYRPRRVTARLTRGSGGGSFRETRLCRGAPLEAVTGACKSKRFPARRLRLAFRRTGADSLAFPGLSLGGIPACGLDQTFPGSWLDEAEGRVDEEALLDGRSLRVVARGATTKEDVLASTPTMKISRRTTVRWALTFRRLG